MTRRVTTSILIAICCLVLMGCSASKLPEEPPTALVLIVGKHNNSKVIDVSLKDKIQSIYGSFGNICVIVCDGNPSVLYNNEGEKVGFYTSQFIEESKEKYQYQSIWKRDYLGVQTQTLVQAIDGCSADDEEVDTLKALQVAADALNEMVNAMDPDDVEQIKKEIIILDTGLATSGELNFLNEEPLELLLSPEQIREESEKRERVQELIEFLDTKMEIPDLSGVVITWYGMGKVAEPQEPLSNLAVDNLQYIWEELLKKAGALVPGTSSADKKTSYFVPTTSDKEEMYDKDVTIVPIVNLTQDERERMDYEVKVEFVANQDVFANEEEAHDILLSYLEQARQYPERQVLLVGSTANYNEGSIELSQERAEKVKQLLVELGMEENRIEVLGLGAEAPWHEDEWVDGFFEEEIAKRNRTVWVMFRDSDKAKKLLEYSE